jgi:hypothetical protein
MNLHGIYEALRERGMPETPKFPWAMQLENVIELLAFHALRWFHETGPKELEDQDSYEHVASASMSGDAERVVRAIHTVTTPKDAH